MNFWGISGFKFIFEAITGGLSANSCFGIKIFSYLFTSVWKVLCNSEKSTPPDIIFKSSFLFVDKLLEIQLKLIFFNHSGEMNKSFLKKAIHAEARILGSTSSKLKSIDSKKIIDKKK